MRKVLIDGLGVRYGSRTIFSGITADFHGGETVSVIGGNGAGKTTFLKALAGLVPHDGTVMLEEEGVRRPLDRKVAYVPQLTSVTSRLTVFEMVLLGLARGLGWRVTPEIHDRVDRTLHAMGIDRYAHEPVASLSGGQKQLVFMAQAFVSEPTVLLLDEPTSALDLRHQLIVMNAARDYARKTGAVTIAVVHDLLAASRFSDRLMLLGEGELQCFDTPEVVLSPERLEAVYRVSVSVENTRAGFRQVVPIKPLDDDK